MFARRGDGAENRRPGILGPLPRIAIFTLGIACVSASPVSAAQTKSFAISWFHTATYAQDGDCPQGTNPDSNGLNRQILQELGKSPEEIERVINGGVDSEGKRVGQLVTNRGRIDGKPVNVYAYPESVPDPQLRTFQGKFAYGFNLDGKGAASPNAFEDPETHERGINNQLYRAVGCVQLYHTRLPDRPYYEEMVWDFLVDSMPAWIFSVTGEDLSRDGDVTVTFDRALEHLTRNAGGGILVDATFRIDTDPRSHAVFRGRIKDRILMIEPGDLHLQMEVTMLAELLLRQAHLRLELKPDGTAQGYLGGYMPWLTFYYMYASDPIVAESNSGVNVPGVYYALKKLADAYPDPKTGQNRFISTTYRIEAVPAFLAPIRPTDKAAAQTALTR